MQPGPLGRSLLNAIALAVVASLFGLFGLPVVFGSLLERGPSLLWLALAVLVCACLLLPTGPIATALAAPLEHLPGMRGARAMWHGRTSLEIARLLVAAGYLILFQSILRQPLVAVFGASVDPFLVEASFTVLALLTLLALLVWAYAAAKPLLEGMARVALDSALTTSPDKHTPEGTETAQAATLLAPPRNAAEVVTDVAESATVASPRRRADTAVAEENDAATLLSPRRDANEAELATLESTQPVADRASTEAAGDPSADSTQVQR